ncbi:MAG TPA: siphovirus Gp157 family protein [Pelagibacterium sp.]|uniref:siphovirus Gp157 family protein n=1 Tax=Pelagibacterium sp. TaxID=1967288 RepID=UPI002C1F4B3D|nr:siphovirus Gp157 family protein [Pelagibacterium sp.]HWJ89069.1 siphovirus Gp157 family protein [Pelagibacterium sp.]
MTAKTNTTPTAPANDNAFLARDVQEFTLHLEAVQRDFPELADDSDLAADTFEGMGFNDLLARLLGGAQDAKHFSAAIADRIGELRQRQERFSRKQDAMRALMFRLMTAAGQQRVQLPEGTLSVSKGRDSVLITDETRLPKWAMRVVKSPDKTAIGERLKAGKKVAGAEMKPGEPGLTVRVA